MDNNTGLVVRRVSDKEGKIVGIERVSEIGRVSDREREREREKNSGERES